MVLNPVMIIVSIILIISGIFIYQNLPNSPWYPEIAVWVWAAYFIIVVLVLFGSWLMGSSIG